MAFRCRVDTDTTGLGYKHRPATNFSKSAVAALRKIEEQVGFTRRATRAPRSGEATRWPSVLRGAPQRRTSRRTLTAKLLARAARGQVEEPADTEM